MSVLIISTPVGPIGSGLGGGVELTIRNIAQGLELRGHHVEVVAPVGSISVGSATHCIDGDLEPSVQFVERNALINEPRREAVLTKMWSYVREHASEYDVILNMAYDALPFRDSPALPVPVAHLVSMGSLTDAMDSVIDGVLVARPSTVAMHSRAQASTFPHGANATIVGSGIDLDRYVFRSESSPDGRLAFIGRIAPEKGLADAIEVAASTGCPLHVWGYMQDEDLWQSSLAQFPDADVHYRGFVSTAVLQDGLGECAGLVMTPKWVEAFGNVAIEALACGVPVVAYNRGGPAEIVVDGVTGFLIPAEDAVALARAVGRLGTIKRANCRARAEAEFSTPAFARRVENWLSGVLAGADFGGMPLSF